MGIYDKDEREDFQVDMLADIHRQMVPPGSRLAYGNRSDGWGLAVGIVVFPIVVVLCALFSLAEQISYQLSFRAEKARQAQAARVVMPELPLPSPPVTLYLVGDYPQGIETRDSRYEYSQKLMRVLEAEAGVPWTSSHMIQGPLRDFCLSVDTKTDEYMAVGRKVKEVLARWDPGVRFDWADARAFSEREKFQAYRRQHWVEFRDRP